MTETLEGDSLDEQLLLAVAESKRIQDMIKIRNEVIKELDRRYKLNELFQLIEKTDSLIDVILVYIDEDDKITRSSMKEKIVEMTTGVKKAVKECGNFKENFRVG
jgi:hypothetical protein